MNKTVFRLIAALTIALSITGCSHDKLFGPSSPPTLPGIQPIPARENPGEEARLAALWVSGELTPPLDLAQRIESDLDLIRERWSDSLALVTLEFKPPWQPACIIVGFEETTFDSILAGEYHAWDSLNTQYGLDSVEIGSYHPSLAWVLLRFDESANASVLCDAYRSLPGVRFASPNRFVGDGPGLFLWRDSESLVYFFREAWGDCLAGCIYAEFDIFCADGSEIAYLGHFSEIAHIPLYYRALWGTAWDSYHR
jgi:hypothetical protein